MLISPTEPKALVALGESSSVPETYGCDILIPGHGMLVGVQRKKFPEDYAASLADGRFARFVAGMGGVDFALVVLEGQPRWTTDGVLVSDYHHITKAQVWGVQWSLLLRGIGTMWTGSTAATCELLTALDKWAAKPAHKSLERRPNPKNDWGGARDRDWQRFLLQGFPGIGPVQADKIIDAFD